MDMSGFRRTLIGAMCLLASTSLVACKRASGDTAPVGDDVKGVGKATEKTAKDIGHNLEDATNKAGADAQDGWITAKVKTELTGAGLDPLHLHVDTEGKVVTLSGTVDSAADAHKAVSAAKAVTGVRGVQNHMFVKPDANGGRDLLQVCDHFLCARIRSISSMVAFISAIAASNGADVVMSTPASFSRSMAYFELPERQHLQVGVAPRGLAVFLASSRTARASEVEATMLVAYW